MCDGVPQVIWDKIQQHRMMVNKFNLSVTVDPANEVNTRDVLVIDSTHDNLVITIVNFNEIDPNLK